MNIIVLTWSTEGAAKLCEKGWSFVGVLDRDIQYDIACWFLIISIPPFRFEWLSFIQKLYSSNKMNVRLVFQRHIALSSECLLHGILDHYNSVVIISLWRSPQPLWLCYIMILVLSHFDLAVVTIVQPQLTLSTILWSMEYTRLFSWFFNVCTVNPKYWTISGPNASLFIKPQLSI